MYCPTARPRPWPPATGPSRGGDRVPDGSTTYAQAIRDTLPDAVQFSDRWHLWNGLARRCARRYRPTVPAGPSTGHHCRRATERVPRWSGGGRSMIWSLLASAAGNRPPPATVAEHGQALRAGQPARAHAACPYRDHLRARRAETRPSRFTLSEVKKLRNSTNFSWQQVMHQPLGTAPAGVFQQASTFHYKSLQSQTTYSGEIRRITGFAENSGTS
jgi:hypothetical protein